MICHQLQDFCWKDQFFRFFNIIKSKPFSQVILKKEVGNHKTSSFKERKHEMVLSVKKLFNKKLFCHFLSNYRSLRVLFVGKVKALKSVFKYIFIIFYVSFICQKTWEEGILYPIYSAVNLEEATFFKFHSRFNYRVPQLKPYNSRSLFFHLLNNFLMFKIHFYILQTWPFYDVSSFFDSQISFFQK